MNHNKPNSFEWMVNAASELMTLINRDHVIEAANEAYCRAWELPREQILGKNLCQLWGEERYKTQIAPLLEQVFATKNAVEFESHFSFNDFGKRDYRVVFYPSLDASGAVTHVVSVTTDITHYKQAEKELREAEYRYRQLVEQVDAVIYLDNTDETSSNIYTSPQIKTLTGYSPEEWLADPEMWVKLIHPDDRARVLAENARVNKDQSPFKIEYRLVARDGRVVWVQDDAVLIKNINDQLVWHGVLHEITARKQMEEKLRQAEQQYRLLVEQIHAVIYLDRDDETNSTLYISPQIKSLVGYTAQEWTEDPALWSKLLHPDDRERVLGEIARRGQDQELFKIEYRLIARDGGEVSISDDSARVTDINGQRVWHGILYDITPLKQAETALQRRVAIEEQITRISTQFITTTPEKMEEEVNRLLQAVGKIAGVDQSFLCLLAEDLHVAKAYEWVAEGIKPMITRLEGMSFEQLPWFISRYKQQEPVVVANRKDFPPEAVSEFEYLLSTFPEIEASLTVPLAGEGFPLGILGVNAVKGERIWPAEDVRLLRLVGQMVFNYLERQRIERAVRESEEKFRRIFEFSPLGIILVDNDLTILDANPRAQAMHGFNSAQEMTGRNAVNIISETDRPKMRELFRKTQAEKETISTEIYMLTREDQSFPAELSFCVVLDTSQNPTGFLVMSDNIASRKQAEQELHTARTQLAQRVSELESRTQHLSQLTEMTNLLQICSHQQEAFTIIANFSNRLFPNLSGVLYTRDEKQPNMEMRTTWGRLPLSASSMSDQDCWALRRRWVYASDNPLTGLICNHITEPIPSSYICVPITANGTEIGLYHLQSAYGQPRLSVDQEQLATALAEQAGLALSNLQLRENLRQQAIHDPLTGLYNRYYLEEFLEIELHRSRRNSQPVSLFMLDLDFFKNFNDRFGHPAGDDLLRALGKLLSSSVRSGDITFRYGGDEFTLILPNTDLDTAVQRAQELRRLAENLVVQQDGLPVRDFTISIGVANCPQHGEEAADILRSADSALYTAKNQGRNQVVVAQHPRNIDESLPRLSHP